ncbi:hypothetical protein D3871_27130 [Noviherbaspirillum saxi]|uniref:Uncharacterized protein n=1 Tax=Noviherbaspirillum saxi TaxID=2320863 RepID=A0A3A3FG11_9BURK|nr:hypothetical protein D3871_27130 [Noviherbaspirillum saxi]
MRIGSESAKIVFKLLPFRTRSISKNICTRRFFHCIQIMHENSATQVIDARVKTVIALFLPISCQISMPFQSCKI